MSHSEQARQCYDQRRIAEAVRHFRLAAACGEDPEFAPLEKWLTMMTAGEFEEAWRESDRVLARRRESGEVCGHLPPHMRFLWDGTPLAGRDVLVRCYHGLGDVIQFIRYMPLLASVCANTRVQVPSELLEFLASAPGIGELISLDHAAPPHDCEIELMEVPHALRATVATIPNRVPYLHVDPTRVREVRDAMAGEKRFRIGLAWASGGWKPERSLPLSCFSFLMGREDVALIGLQRGPATGDLSPGDHRFVHTNWGDNSVANTAAIVQNLDLVISTDTMVAHLAGALAVPVWTMLPFHADWRWMHSREDSPWYPTMRLFRQEPEGNWNSVVGRVRKEVEVIIRRGSRYQREGLRP